MAQASAELAERLRKRNPEMQEVKIEATAVPAAPGYPEVVSAKATSLLVKWAAPTPAEDNNHKQLKYRVEFGGRYFGGWVVATEACGTTTYTVTGLTPATTYVMRVTASNSKGWGAPSANSYPMTTITEAEETALAAAEEQRRKAAEAESQARHQLHKTKAQTDAERKIAALEEQLHRTQLQAHEAERVADELRKTATQQAEVLALQVEALKKEVERAHAEEQARREAMEKYKQEAENAVAKMQEQSQELQSQLQRAITEAAETTERHRQQLQQRSEEERSALTAAQRAEVEAANKRMEELRSQLAAVEASKQRAAEDAETRARAEIERVRAEAAAARAQAEDLETKHEQELQQLQIAMKALNDANVEAQRQVKAVAADKATTEELLRIQQEQAQKAVQERETQLRQMQQRQEDLNRAIAAEKARADAEAKATEAYTQTIMAQAEENEQLKRLAKYNAATIRMLQGAGPNPSLEMELVKQGNDRESVRFFMEVYGWEDRRKLEECLKRMRELSALSYSADAIRECIVVKGERADVEELKAYLRDFAARHATLRLAVSSPIDDNGDEGSC